MPGSGGMVGGSEVLHGMWKWKWKWMWMRRSLALNMVPAKWYSGRGGRLERTTRAIAERHQQQRLMEFKELQGRARLRLSEVAAEQPYVDDTSSSFERPNPMTEATTFNKGDTSRKTTTSSSSSSSSSTSLEPLMSFSDELDLYRDMLESVVAVEYPELCLSDILEALERGENYLGSTFSLINVASYSNVVSFIFVLEEASSRRRVMLQQLLVSKYRGFLRPSSPMGDTPRRSSVDKKGALLDSSDWLLLDFQRLYLHILSPERRRYLDLEALWTIEIPQNQCHDAADSSLDLDPDDPDVEASQKATEAADVAASRDGASIPGHHDGLDAAAAAADDGR